MTAKRRRLMPAERLQRIALELVAVAPGAPWLLRRTAGLPLDSPSGRQLGLTRQPSAPPKGQP
jgi:hypothetical protein